MSTGTAALSRLREASPTGRSRTWCACVLASQGRRRRDSTLEARRHPHRANARQRRAGVRRALLAASGIAEAVFAQRRPVRLRRLFFERLANTYPTVLVFGTYSGPATCSTSSVPLSGRSRARSSFSSSPVPSSSTSGRTGAPALQPRSSRQLSKAAMTGLLDGFVPACQRSCAANLARAEGIRCTPWRRCGCCSTEDC
jgi:hypothetical protein